MNYLLASSHEEMNPNRRHTMEDVHRIVPCLCGDESLSYFAVYDGHGGYTTPCQSSSPKIGRHIVDFLEETLERNIYNELLIPDEASVLDRIGRSLFISHMI
jgi:serine/threonine protein phosphatase PrpC